MLADQLCREGYHVTSFLAICFLWSPFGITVSAKKVSLSTLMNQTFSDVFLPEGCSVMSGDRRITLSVISLSMYVCSQGACVCVCVCCAYVRGCGCKCACDRKLGGSVVAVQFSALMSLHWNCGRSNSGNF